MTALSLRRIVLRSSPNWRGLSLSATGAAGNIGLMPSRSIAGRLSRKFMVHCQLMVLVQMPIFGRALGEPYHAVPCAGGGCQIPPLPEGFVCGRITFLHSAPMPSIL